MRTGVDWLLVTQTHGTYLKWLLQQLLLHGAATAGPAVGLAAAAVVAALT